MPARQIWRAASTPSISGIVTSISTTSGWSSTARATASMAVGRLADHVEALVEHRSLERVPEHPVVVGEQQADRHVFSRVVTVSGR